MNKAITTMVIRPLDDPNDVQIYGRRFATPGFWVRGGWDVPIQ